MTQSESTSEDIGFTEWLTLLELTTTFILASDELVEGMKGELGVDTRAPDATEQAVVESKRRVDAYVSARNALIEYARSREAMLT